MCDGDRALWEKVKALSKTLGVLIVCILDLYHVLERLWSAAYCFHPEGSDQAQRFVAERLRRLLEGEVGYVIGGLNAVYLNGDWDAFQCYRMNTTTRKLYPCRQFISRLYRKTGWRETSYAQMK